MRIRTPTAARRTTRRIHEGRERERHSGDRQDPGEHARDRKGLQAEPGRVPAANNRAKRSGARIAIRIAANRKAPNIRSRTRVPRNPSSSPMIEKMKSVWAFGCRTTSGRWRPGPTPQPRSGGELDHATARSGTRCSASLRGGARNAKNRDPPVLRGHDQGEPEHQTAAARHGQVAQPHAGREQHEEHRGGQNDRRSEVRLQQDQTRTRPRRLGAGAARPGRGRPGASTCEPAPSR